MAKTPKPSKAKAPEVNEQPTALPDDSFPQLPADFEIPQEMNQENELRIRSLCEMDSWGFVPPEPVRNNMENVSRFLVQEPELFRNQITGFSTCVELLTDEHGLISVHPQPEESVVIQRMKDLYNLSTAATVALSSREMRVMLKSRTRELARLLREDPILLVAMQEYVRSSYFGIGLSTMGLANSVHNTKQERLKLHENLGLKPSVSALDVAIIDFLYYGKNFFDSATPIEFYTSVPNPSDMLRRTVSSLSCNFLNTYPANYPLDTRHYNGPVGQLYCEEATAAFDSAFYIGVVIKDCVPFRLEAEIIHGNILPKGIGKKENAFLSDRNMETVGQFLLRDFSDAALEFADIGEGLGKMLLAQLRYAIYRCNLRSSRLNDLIENLKTLSAVGVDIDGIATHVPHHHHQTELNTTERNRAY